MKTALSLLRAKWRALTGRRRLDEEFSEELAAHLEMLAADFQAKGMGQADALRAARLKLGFEESLKEINRDQRGWPLAESIAQDVRYALRAWRRNPMFALGAILTLALGIGANTSVFTFLNTVMFTGQGGAGDGRFAQLYPQKLEAVPNGQWVAAGDRGLSYDEFQAFQKAPSLQSLAVWSEWRPSYGDGDTASDPTRVKLVSYGALDVLGLKEPLRGRWFTRAECRPGGDSSVVLVVESTWRTLFRADPRLLGRTLRLEGHTLTVIGILPESFNNRAMGRSDFVVPVSFQQQLGADAKWYRDTQWLEATGRLKPGATRAQLREELNALARQFDTQNPRTSMDVLVTDGSMVERPFLRPKLMIVLPLLQAAMGLVLLIACSNVASLLLSRAAVRQREVAVRLSLGAARGRLFRQLLTESLLLGLCAGALSLWFALRIPPLLAIIIPQQQRPILAPEFQLNLRLLGYTAAAALLAGVVAGLAPALESMKLDLYSSLKGTGSVWSGKRRFRSWLVSVQVAASLVLLLGSGLLLRTMESVRGVGEQFQPETLMVTEAWFRSEAYDAARMDQVAGQLRQRIVALPGVKAVSLTHGLPMRSPGKQTATLPQGDRRSVEARYTDPNYFQVFGLPLRRGRLFTAAEMQRAVLKSGETAQGKGPWPAVIAQPAAEMFFPGQDPLGRAITLNDPAGPILAEVVGVVASTGPIPNESPFVLYLPFPLRSERTFILTRFEGDGRVLQRSLEDLRSEFDPGLLRGSQKLTMVYEDLLSSLKPLAGVVAAISGLAVLLAMIGIYGVLAFAVSQRTRELGIRLALGAKAGEVSALMLKTGLKPVLLGLLGGLPLGIVMVKLLARFTQSMGMGAWDSRLYGLVLLLLLGSAGLSLLLPALRAGRIDPLRALREE
ncbi:MAG: ABC transporter permease [Acidobacteria bacterium]|nr:ABC transporter permease [Acidobacteriota bacterium]